MAGNTLVFTDRDRRLCAEVLRFGALTREQAMRLGFFHSQSRAKERLKKLVDHGLLITKPHAVSQRGVRFVYLPGRELTKSRDRLLHASTLFVAHQLGLVDIRMTFERDTLVQRWWTDRELAPLALGVIPDSYVEYTHDAKSYGAFIEYDRGTETLSRIERKIRAYLDLAYSGRFERMFHRKFFRLLLVTDSARRLSTLSKTVAGVTDRVVRFTTLDELIIHGSLGSIWRRPGATATESLTGS